MVFYYIILYYFIGYSIVLGSIFLRLSHSGVTEEMHFFVILVLRETASRIPMYTCTFKYVHLHACVLAAFSNFKFCASAFLAKASHAYTHPVSQRRFTPCREYFVSQRRCTSCCVSEGAESGRRGCDLAET